MILGKIKHLVTRQNRKTRKNANGEISCLKVHPRNSPQTDEEKCKAEFNSLKMQVELLQNFLSATKWLLLMIQFNHQSKLKQYRNHMKVLILHVDCKTTR